MPARNAAPTSAMLVSRLSMIAQFSAREPTEKQAQTVPSGSSTAPLWPRHSASSRVRASLVISVPTQPAQTLFEDRRAFGVGICKQHSEMTRQIRPLRLSPCDRPSKCNATFSRRLGICFGGLVQRLQRKNRVTLRQIVERFYGRSLRDREETLHLGSEAVEIGLEDRRP